MDSGQALEIARDATPQTEARVDSDDPQGLEPGQTVRVTPDVDGGDPDVEGRVVLADMDTIAIARSEPRVGDVVVHFPRVGYRVTPLA